MKGLESESEVESEVAQSCPTLCYPMEYSPPVSSVHGIFRQEYWSGLPFPSPGDLPNPGIEPSSPALQVDSLPAEPQGKPICWHRLPGLPWATSKAGCGRLCPGVHLALYPTSPLTFTPRLSAIGGGGGVQSLIRVWFFCDPMNCVAHQAPLPMGFPRQEYWRGLPFPFPGDLPNPGVEPESPALQMDSLPLSHLGSLSPMLIFKCVQVRFRWKRSLFKWITAWPTTQRDFTCHLWQNYL